MVESREPSPARASLASRLTLHEPGWHQDHSPEHNVTLPPMRPLRGYAALACVALVAAVALKAWLAQPDLRAERAPEAAARIALHWR